MYDSSNNCPHCKQDRRHIEEIIQDIRDNYDEIIDISSNDFEFDSNQFMLDLKSLSKHPANQFDPIRLDMSKNILPLLTEYDELWEDYCLQIQQDNNQDDLTATICYLNQIIPKIKKEISKLLSDYPGDFKFPTK